MAPTDTQDYIRNSIIFNKKIDHRSHHYSFKYKQSCLLLITMLMSNYFV